MLASTVFGLARPAAGDALSDAKAKAAAIEAQLSQAQNEMSALSQQYDAAVYHLSQINSNITTTTAAIASDQQQVAQDKAVLSKAAVATYISDGTAAAQNPIFGSNEKTLGAQAQYSQIATGDITLAVDNLHTAENSLNAQEAQLANEQTQAQTQVQAEQNAVAQNQQAIDQQKSALSQEQGQIAQLVQQQQAAEAAAAAAAAAAKQRAAAAAAAAVQTAPSSTGGGGGGGGGSASPGFDCSGLTAWSWGQVGVGLPHFSGAQMADSAPVPISDLQPGDLLFYGPGGSDHVAMYVGGGSMIEAPYTGASVWVTGLRLGSGFVGAGRP